MKKNKFYRFISQSLGKSLAPLFIISGLLIILLTAAYWVFDVKPRLITEATTNTRVLAASKAEAIENVLRDIKGPQDVRKLHNIINQFLIIKDRDTGLPLYLGVNLELDSDALKLEQKLDTTIGETNCSQCIVVDNPLYSRKTNELIGVVTMYANPVFHKRLIRDIGQRLALILGSSIIVLILSWYATTQLIRRLVENEKRLKLAKAQAEQANKAKSTFLATMSHEIRTPLSGILGYLSLLEKTQLEVMQKEYIQTINTSAHSLLGIIEDILDLSKIEADKLSFTVEDINLKKIIEQKLSSLSVHLQHRPIDLIANIQYDFPNQLMGDPVRIGQIVTNLVSNAIKFTENGYVSVSLTSEIHGTNEVLVTLSVEDTGNGIAEKDLEVVFLPFVQLDSSLTRTHSGSGLGLVIVKRLINMMGGELLVESEPGKGSKFHVQLPLKLADNQHPVSTQEYLGKQIIVATPSLQQKAALSEILRTAKIKWLHNMEDIRTAQNMDFSDYDYLILDDSLNVSALDCLCESIDKNIGITNIQILVLGKPGSALQLPSLAHIPELHHINKPVFAKTLIDALRDNLPPITAFVANNSNANYSDVHILLVEDDDINCQFMSQILKSFGVIFETAKNGQEAVDKFQEKHFDLLLMDIHMPIMNGLQAATRIRQMEPQGQKVYIVAITADTQKKNMNDIQLAGFDEALIKPVLSPQINALIAKTQNTQSPRSP